MQGELTSPHLSPFFLFFSFLFLKKSKQLVTEYEKDLKEFVDVVQTDTTKQKEEVEKSFETYKEKVGKSIEAGKLVENFNSAVVTLMGPGPLGGLGGAAANPDVSMGGSQL